MKIPGRPDAGTLTESYSGLSRPGNPNEGPTVVRKSGAETASKVRLAALYTHPTQYAVPLFRELSRRSEVDLTVYFLGRQGLDVTFDASFGQSFQWDIPLLDGYKHKFLPNLNRPSASEGFFKFANVSVINEIRAQRHDALLVHGYEHCAKWLAFAAGASCRTRLIFRGESNLNEPRSFVRRAAKEIVLRSLFKCFAGITYIGTLNRAYYEAYGVEPARLHLAPYSVDNRFFAEAARDLQPRRRELRSALGIYDDAPVILSVAKLIEVKQPEMLLAAFAKVRERHPCHLVFVGDGALRARIEAQAAGIPGVRVTGFVNQTRIPEMHVCGDILVLPSRHEPWGLAVNEAMASGLPVVVSDRVGCAVDLVREGVNGYTVRYDDRSQLADRLEYLVKNPRLRLEFGRKAQEIIAGWSVEHTANGIVRAALGV